ncbi:ATP-binding protein [Micromonospora parastrephiae]|uniref:ATP-binding protein n=1 Tax=Micromonospora parastrephiae TaxID=2806101 RepID=UPI0028153264|nr:ATP-binding protein [Micromonospora parastrephiae]
MQLTVLRGRDDECRTIQGLLDAITDGGGSLLVHGEPGSGRTALLGHAHRHVEGRTTTVLAGAGLAEEAALPYAGLQRLLDPLLDRAAALPKEQRHLLRRALGGEDCPNGRQLALSMAVLGLLAVAARDRPLLVTMDDVDLGDPQTGRVLAFAARRLRRLPVVVLLTADVTATIDGIAAHRLRPLTERESAAVLTDRLRLRSQRQCDVVDADRPPERPAPPVVAALGVVGGGNPQALADLADVLTPGQWRGEERLPTVPPTDGALGRAYRTRLDRLPPSTRRLLLLAALDEESGPGAPTRATRAAVEALARRRSPAWSA